MKKITSRQIALNGLVAGLYAAVTILPTILCNMLMVGAMLSAVLMPASEFWKGLAVFGAEVGAGEAVVLYILGIPLYQFIRKTKLIDKLLGRG